MAIIKLNYNWEHNSNDYEESFEMLEIRYSERYCSFEAKDSRGKNVVPLLSESTQDAINDMIDEYLLTEDERMDSWTWDYSDNDEGVEY